MKKETKGCFGCLGMIATMGAFAGGLYGMIKWGENEKRNEIEQHNKPIYATVLEEKYYSGIPGKENIGLFISDDPGFASHYILKIKTDDGKIMAINITDGLEGTSKETLDSLISEGTRISFPQGNKGEGEYKHWVTEGNKRVYETFVEENTQLASKPANRIRIEK